MVLQQQKKQANEKVEEAFKYFDENQDGFVSKEELQHILGDIEIENIIWEDILHEVDVNGDGMLNIDEFVEFLTQKAGSL